MTRLTDEELAEIEREHRRRGPCDDPDCKQLRLFSDLRAARKVVEAAREHLDVGGDDTWNRMALAVEAYDASGKGAEDAS